MMEKEPMSQSDVVAAVASGGNEENSTLKQQLWLAQKAYKKRSLLLIAPLFLFIVVSFLFPITSILGKSVSNPELRDNMPQTIAAMRLWSGNDVPDEAVFRALVGDLRDVRSSGKLSTITKRLGYEGSEYRTLITRTLRKLPAEGSSDIRAQLIREQPMWGELATWQTFGLSPAITYWRCLTTKSMPPRSRLSRSLPIRRCMSTCCCVRC
jgi:putative spermidine/putrescine transport system permease protein